MNNGPVQPPIVNKVRRGMMLFSILAKVVMLLVLLPFTSGTIRWVLILIFVTTILAQTLVLLRTTRR